MGAPEASDHELIGRGGKKDEQRKNIYRGRTMILWIYSQGRRWLTFHSTRPQRARQPGKRAPTKMNEDGKLVIGLSDSDSDGMAVDSDGGKKVGLAADQGAVDAYVEAIKGKDSFRRGERGKVKFSNKRNKGDEMDVDDDTTEKVIPKLKEGPAKHQRRGLGGIKRGRGTAERAGGRIRGGRVAKDTRSRGRRR